MKSYTTDELNAIQQIISVLCVPNAGDSGGTVTSAPRGVSPPSDRHTRSAFTEGSGFLLTRTQTRNRAVPVAVPSHRTFRTSHTGPRGRGRLPLLSHLLPSVLGDSSGLPPLLPSQRVIGACVLPRQTCLSAVGQPPAPLRVPTPPSLPAPRPPSRTIYHLVPRGRQALCGVLSQHRGGRLRPQLGQKSIPRASD